MKGVVVRQVHSISYITFHLNNLQQKSLKAQQLVCEYSANFYAMSFVALKAS
jgi:hypothetical protein